MHDEVAIALQKDNEVIIVADFQRKRLYFKIITVQQMLLLLYYQDFR